MASVSCLEFLAKKRKGDPPGVIAAHGDSDFLRREARYSVRDWVLGSESTDFSYSAHEGDSATGAVLDELFTPPFLGERRLVVVENADDFVSKHRPALEKIARAPSSVGILVLDVRTWAATTKLAQAVTLAIQCNTPKDHLVPGWCMKWCQHRHKKRIDQDAAALLVDSVGAELGILDQELAKLAAFIGDEETVERKQVAMLVAGRGSDDVFAILDQALDGDLPKSLDLLDRTLSAGEPEVKILAILGAQLRKLGEAARRAVTGASLESAVRDAGVPPFVAAAAARRLKSLGRVRAAELYRRILDADFSLKGGRELEARTVLERLLIWLASGKG